MFRFSYDSGLNGNSGVYGQSGLYDKSGLYAVEFNLQNLDPYLLFDTSEGSMIGTLENPTLDLDPSNPDSLDVITATRSSVATRTLPDGTISLAEQDTVRVDYTQGAELTPTKFQLVGNTDFTQSHWTKTASTVESGHTSPDGNANAYKLIEDTSNSVHRIFETSTVSASPNATISVFVKYSGRRYVLIRFADQSVGRWYDLISGSLGITYLATPNDSTIEEIGNDWYRITLTHTSNAQARCEFWVSDTQSISSYTGDGTSGVYIYGPQLEEGTTASSFVANTTGSPKFITGATYGPRVPMILVEPSSENLLLYSEDFSQSAWSKNNVTLLSGFSAPDGSMNASKLEANATDSSLQNTFTVASGTTYSVSFYLKTISGSLETAIALGSPGFPQNEGEGGRYKNITVTDEWQRFTLTSTADANAATGISFGGFNSFSTGEEVYIWGAQLETGIATSYIPTAGGDAAARTRAADDLEIAGSAFSDFYNTSEGTVYVEYEPRIVSPSNCLFNFSDGSGSHRILSLVSEAYSLYINISSNLYVAFGVNTDPQIGTLNQLACSFKTNDARASLNGAAEVTDNSISMPTITQLNLGARQDGTQPLNGHIKRLIYWPTHSSRL